MLTHSEIKAIMAKKFKEENCCFTENDIKVRLINSHIEIQIRDYDHITFKIVPMKVDGMPFVVGVFEGWTLSKHSNEIVGYHDSSKDYPFEEALIDLAYHIAQTF